MLLTENASFLEEYKSFLHRKEYPCVAAKAAVQKQQIRVLVADHMACPKDDRAILDFLYNFVDEYRSAKNLFHSVAIIFKGPELVSEEDFEKMLWARLQLLPTMGAHSPIPTTANAT